MVWRMTHMAPSDTWQMNGRRRRTWSLPSSSMPTVATRRTWRAVSREVSSRRWSVLASRRCSTRNAYDPVNGSVHMSTGKVMFSTIDPDSGVTLEPLKSNGWKTELGCYCCQHSYDGLHNPFSVSGGRKSTSGVETHGWRPHRVHARLPNDWERLGPRQHCRQQRHGGLCNDPGVHWHLSGYDYGHPRPAPGLQGLLCSSEGCL
mmetsp:Transcript_136341/g.192808  ORF Transcript_136341/g.192808 Transcript_136341/m.192808 type:complete len:204 (-) Transcript_136341:89-700(-)